jgi:hypothetical protein
MRRRAGGDAMNYDLVAQKYGEVVPSSYLAMAAAGLYARGEDAVALDFSDMWFMSPSDVAAWRKPFDFMVDGLMPFAWNARRDLWCWYGNVRPQGETPIVKCPRDCDTGEYWAPTYTGFVYRAVVEEYCGSWLFEVTPNALAVLRSYPDLLEPFLPSAWT